MCVRAHSCALDHASLAQHVQDKGGARAVQVVRALDTLQRALTDLADLGVQGGGRVGEELHDAAMQQVHVPLHCVGCTARARLLTRAPPPCTALCAPVRAFGRMCKCWGPPCESSQPAL